MFLYFITIMKILILHNSLACRKLAQDAILYHTFFSVLTVHGSMTVLVRTAA